MRDILHAVAAGELSPEAAEATLSGYATTEAGRFDAAREDRSGVPEAVLAAGKTTAETATLAKTSLETTDRAIVTRLPDASALIEAIEEADPAAEIQRNERAQTLVAHRPAFEPPELEASVGVVTAGTADALPAGEAAVVASEMGATVERIDDVGVAALTRLTDRLPDLREHDVLLVVAGREGALPTVVAGLVDVPVIGVPASVGYGYGGQGGAALAGMCQSCTALTLVNVDAGFTAGAQAGLIAKQLDEARTDG
ncbi:hypothetical protein BRC87_09145 [Halobacteriales archaeon QS_4_66_20]|nr:MAG: hypothetical protein BRC87_09145 [Halobacteriales archaeon QS_4_66_20]